MLRLPEILRAGEPLFPENAVRRTFRRKILKIEVPDQEENNWCWAAVAVGIAKAYGDFSLTQCGVATLMFRDDNPAPQCCAEDQRGVCDRQAALSEVLAIPDHVRLEEVLPAQEFTFIEDEINAGRPIAVGIQRLDSDGKEASGHFAVITGYLRATGADGESTQEYVYFDDPLAKRGVRSFDSFRLRSDGKWISAYKTKGTEHKPRVEFRVVVPPEH